MFATSLHRYQKADQGSVITGDGRLSQEGKRRIESAVAQHAYGDSVL